MRFIFAMVVISFILLMVSCENSFFLTVSRPNADPIASAISVQNFKILGGIPLTWEADPLADSYNVYRESVDTKQIDVVYRGEDNQYIDNTAIPDVLYQYSLSKVRGTKEFEKGTAVVGSFSTSFTKDPNGYNDVKENAVELWTSQRQDQINFYATKNIVLEDIDWFFVDVPARMQVNYIFTYVNTNQSSQLAVETENGLSTLMSNASTVVLQNSSLENKRMYFKVFAGNGSTIVTLSPKLNIKYSIMVDGIIPWNP